MSNARLTTRRVPFGLQTRLAFDRLFERIRAPPGFAAPFCKAFDLPVRHLQDATDIAQHAARLQCSKGDDLRDLITAVSLLHVAEHFVAAVLTESMSKSGIDTRSGLRKRSNSRPNLIGSRSVIVSA